MSGAWNAAGVAMYRKWTMHKAFASICVTMVLTIAHFGLTSNRNTEIKTNIWHAMAKGSIHCLGVWLCALLFDCDSLWWFCVLHPKKADYRRRLNILTNVLFEETRVFCTLIRKWLMLRGQLVQNVRCAHAIVCPIIISLECNEKNTMSTIRMTVMLVMSSFVQNSLCRNQ